MPLTKYQAAWLLNDRGGTVPTEVMDSFQKLLDISRERGESFEEICSSALSEDSGTTPHTTAD